MWFAHFLGLTALLMGLVAAPARTAAPYPAMLRVCMMFISLVLALALALTLRDYVRLDSTRITGTTLTLAPPRQSIEDAATMRTLGNSLLAPTADYWKVQKASLDRHELQDKLQASSRAIRLFPGPSIVVRHAIFLAFDGQTEEAGNLLLHALHSFPRHCDFIHRLVDQASGVDPDAIASMQSASRDYRCSPGNQL